MNRECEPAAVGGGFLLLRPEEATLLDLMALLFARRGGVGRSVESSASWEAVSELRFVIVASLVGQKLLLWAAPAMAWLGSLLEMWLNTLSYNSGIQSLLPRFLWGKVMIPDPTSKNFVSTVGHLDTRVLLDGSIQPGDSRYIGALAIMAAKTAYENSVFTRAAVTDFWKMEYVGSYDFWNARTHQYSTHSFIMMDKSTTGPGTIVISFRGTQPFNASQWCTNMDLSWYEIPGVGRVHAGFMEALGMQKTIWPKETNQNGAQPHLAYYFLRKRLMDLLKENPQAKFIVTGHSLGGGLAIMFASILAVNGEDSLLERMEGVYTFGQPRVGDEQFGNFVTKQFNKNGNKYYRYVYCNDIIPRLPAADSNILYKHFGTGIYFNSLYQGKCLKEDPIKNYSPLCMLLNAFWGLVRSFIIGLMLGQKYKEGWFLVLCRTTGLLIPGVADHAIQDYNNAARMGTFPNSKP